jgi:hypothetical protein
MEKEEQVQTIADPKAQLATISGEKADLEKRLLIRETEVKKLRRDASEVLNLKEELSALREASSKIIP